MSPPVPHHPRRDGVLTLHRDNLSDVFIAKSAHCCCLRVPAALRFGFFVAASLSGFFLLAMTLPLTGLLQDVPLAFGAVYVLSKALLYASLLALADPLKQLMHCCRPVRFCALAFAAVGTVGVWVTLSSLSTSVVILILSVLLQMASFAFYTLSFLSFTHNILFDCMRRPAFGRHVSQGIPCLRERRGDAAPIAVPLESSPVQDQSIT